MNHQRGYRLYREEGLSLRVKRPRRQVSAADREGRVPPGCRNDSGSRDLVSDSLWDGRRLGALTLVDNCTRESLAIVADQGLQGAPVVDVLDRIVAERGAAKSIRVDNRPEFVSKALDRWAYEQGVRIDFSRPGKPTDNAFVESFNGTFRAECLDAPWFTTLTETRQIVETWRREYNESRPHRALGGEDAEGICCSARGMRRAEHSTSSRRLNLRLAQKKGTAQVRSVM